MNTVWIFGDQLNRSIASLADATPETTRILMVRNEGFLAIRKWHRQRLHLVLTSMRRFADELRAEGFEVDEQLAESFPDGLAAHRKKFSPDRVLAMETLSEGAVPMLEEHGVEVVRTNQMLCHYDDFAKWAGNVEHLRMEDFYRWQRVRLDLLMDGDTPAGGQWNFDHDNREPPPKEPRDWYGLPNTPLDDLDHEILDSLPPNAVGADPIGLWATNRQMAVERLNDFIENVLPEFGPYEDAMLMDERRLAHSLLSHAINIGLLMPEEVVHAAEDAYRAGKVPIASAEGFIRQIIGWREFIWNVYWRWMPEYRHLNELKANEDLPPMFDDGKTNMQCMSKTFEAVDQWAYAHHIQRLMVIGNFAMISSIRPQHIVEWMIERFIDSADWVMQPNVLGLAMYADGGRMSTKPYAAGGAYINRMSNYCKSCKYNPKKRVGDDACPFTTMYWDFIDRNKPRFAANHRMSQPVRGLERLTDMDEVRERAREVKRMMQAGEL